VARESIYEERIKNLKVGRTPPTVIDVGCFKPADFRRVARHLCLQWSRATYDMIQDTLPKLEENFVRGQAWTGDLLKRIEDACQAFHR
jgi:hypothetical protein